MDFYKKRLRILFESLRAQLKGLNAREKGLVGFVIVGALVWALVSTAQSIDGYFESQTIQLAKLREWEKFLPVRIVTYQSLRKRRQEIEERFKSSDAQTAIPTYLESVFSEKIGTRGSNLAISNQPQAPLGEGYIQTPFSVRFQVTDVQPLVAFLTELNHGKQPLIVSEIEMAKTYAGDRVEVSLKVSGVRARGAGDA